MKFEIEHLESYDDAALLDELRRVASLIDAQKLTREHFSAISNVHDSTLRRRFGGWRAALKAAGLSDRIDASNVATTRTQILELIRAAAATLGSNSFTRREFQDVSGISNGPIYRHFGTWKNAVIEAGFVQAALSKRYSDEECFENLLKVWTHYGRPPKHTEMTGTPSAVGPKAYVLRWGTWRKSLSAFVRRVNEPEGDSVIEDAVLHATTVADESPFRDRRNVSLSLRYAILKRDSFRCVACGSSPALSHGLVLHIDHIVPWAHGGRTELKNLRTLCSPCNLGKGVSPAF
jgi:hypothetical protein